MPLGPSASYLAKYNGYTLPGYVQQESIDSTMEIVTHYAPYADGSESEYIGLQNKMLSLTLKVWEADYLSCKNQVQQAATMLRSNRNGFAPLYVQYTDRYFDAQVSTIRIEKVAGGSVRTLDYQVDFECKPWQISTASYVISGNAMNGTAKTITTTGRSIADGGWTPTLIKVSGTNVTISGYTATGEFTGFVSISGATTNTVINSDAFTATDGTGTANRNHLMRWVDYRTYIGPEVTSFYVTGAQFCEIWYNKRWYI